MRPLALGLGVRAGGWPGRRTHLRPGRSIFVLQLFGRIAPSRVRPMDTWESFFREKSRRRFRRQSRTRFAKAAIVALLVADVVIATVMLMR